MCGLAQLAQAQIAGTAVSSVGAFYEAQGQRDALSQRAATAETNARLAELTAQSAILSGQEEERRIRQYGANVKSSQRVALAAGNLDLSSAGSIAALTSTDVLTEQDALAVKVNAANAAWGYRVQGVNYKNEARSAQAYKSGISPLLSAVPSALAGASAVAETNYKLRRVREGY
jgi:hypothetical protein